MTNGETIEQSHGGVVPAVEELVELEFPVSVPPVETTLLTSVDVPPVDAENVTYVLCPPNEDPPAELPTVELPPVLFPAEVSVRLVCRPLVPPEYADR
jgi:hypothetical protein